MAGKKAVAKKFANKRPAKEDVGTPVFPYTSEPGALRRLLKEIPNRPKPPKMTRETLKSWNVSSSNNSGTVISVLKRIGLLNDGGTPTDAYAEFMKASNGSAVLAAKVRETYRVLFENSNAPQSESPENLKSMFNIHTGGGEDNMRLQMQTFKILTEFSNFTDVPPAGSPTGSQAGNGGRQTQCEPSPAASTDRSSYPLARKQIHARLRGNHSGHRQVHLWTRNRPSLALLRALWGTSLR
jgi:hypothetical protein